MRGSLHTRNWKDAETLLNSKIQPYLRGETVAADITVEQAVLRFLKTKRTDIPARKNLGSLSESVVEYRRRTGRDADDEQEQVRKYRDVLTPLQTFCKEEGLVLLKQVTADHLDDFRATWKGRPIWKDGSIVGYKPKTQAGKQRYQQNLRIFFAHALDRDWLSKNPASIGRSLARYRHTPTRLQTPPFKPCVRFSRTRLTDDLLDVACVMPVPGRVLAFHRVVMPVVTAFANSRSRRTHLAHTHSRIVQLSRFIKGVVGHFWHALTLTSPPT